LSQQIIQIIRYVHGEPLPYQISTRENTSCSKRIVAPEALKADLAAP
jgi:hypothetical protein